MKVIVIDHQFSRTEIAVADKDVVETANILEASTTVKSFYVDGMNVLNQQEKYGAGGFTKWSSPIQQ
jgi:hypothetical protein